MRRLPSPVGRRIAAVLATAILSGSPARADISLAITGQASIVFDSARDGCEPNDVPDINPRAIRDASGAIVMYALHFENRPLRGPNFAHLKIDCHVALGSPLDPDPAHFADRAFVAALWTRDGRAVDALIHEEYHADDFHRCQAVGNLACWYNTILSYRSGDGGLDFTRTPHPVVAAAPFRQDVGQGRHRGFFNPSNIVADGRWTYALISTTGWDGQPFGNCLFRTADPGVPGSWRAFDGASFSIRYDDPYVVASPRPKPCRTIGPFPYPVGALVRHKPTGTWIALFQAAVGGAFPVDGIYYATGRDLFHWNEPRILLTHATLYDDLCKVGSSIVAYPSMMDSEAPGRNFDEVGDHPDLFLTTIAVDKCQTGTRLLVREGLTITRDGP